MATITSFLRHRAGFLTGFIQLPSCPSYLFSKSSLSVLPKHKSDSVVLLLKSLRKLPLVIGTLSKLLTVVIETPWLAPTPCSCSLRGFREILFSPISLISVCSLVPYPFPKTGYLFSLLLLWIVPLLVPQGNLFCSTRSVCSFSFVYSWISFFFFYICHL